MFYLPRPSSLRFAMASSHQRYQPAACVPGRSATASLQDPPAMQRLEAEMQDLACQGEQQLQNSALQMQCLQQACQDTVQHERRQSDQQVSIPAI